MISKLVLLGLISCLVEVSLQSLWIQNLRKMKVAQIIKSYGPKRHLEVKVGTPTMGGTVFIIMGLGIMIAGQSDWGILTHELSSLMLLPLGAAIIGFLDDWLKFSRSSSEGLSSHQKLVGQILVVLPWSIWISLEKGIWLLPHISVTPVLGIPLLLFLGVGFLNAVNISDGLDGLAAGSCLLSFTAALMWLGPKIAPASVFGMGLCGGFLWHNSHPASIFMGDVGAHFLGGLLIAIALNAHSLLALFPLAFLFGVETVTVILQLVSLKLTGKRIFRMSPIHHHFELCGWSEPQIVNRFLIIHSFGMAALAILIGFIDQ